MNTFGEKLKDWRIKNNKTQKDIAKELNIAESSVAMYENNERVPRDGLKIEFAKMMKDSIENIFFN